MTTTATLPVSIGQVRRRVSYDLRVIGFLPLGNRVAILEAMDDRRRTTASVDEVATWPIVAVSA